jgi:hypothetical protein
MMIYGGEGVSKKQIADQIQFSGTTIQRRFEDLVLLNVISPLGKIKVAGKGNNPVLFKVTDHVANLWREAKGEKKKITSVKREKKQR